MTLRFFLRSFGHIQIFAGAAVWLRLSLIQKMKKFGVVTPILYLCVTPFFASAAELQTDRQELIRAEVVRVVHEKQVNVPGTELQVLLQTLDARTRTGEILTFEYDLSPKLSAGNSVIIKRTTTIEGDVYLTYQDRDRRGVLSVLALAFVALFVLMLGKRSWRALLSLVLSLCAIFFILVPAILAGYPPTFLTIVVAGGVLALIIFLSHGLSSHGAIAFSGTFIAVGISIALASLVVALAGFTGTGSDAAVYLNVSTRGTLDLPGVLLASIIIGMLGVLDDVAITQAAIVEELKAANPAYRFTELYRSAMRVGRDHIGALTNTLVFAYVGAAFPLVLLMSLMDTPLTYLVNQEMVADEIVRLLVGSMGLMLAVPITTVIAAYWWHSRAVNMKESIPTHAHTHIHE